MFLFDVFTLEASLTGINGGTVIGLFTESGDAAAVFRFVGLCTTDGVDGLLSKDEAGVGGKFIHQVRLGNVVVDVGAVPVRNCGT